MAVNLKSLIGKLNEPTRSALEASAGLCLSRTHYDIEIEHYLTKLLDATGSDFYKILSFFEVDKSRLTGELARALDKLKSGNARTPVLSPSLMKMLTEAWTVGSIDYDAAQIRSGFTILALTANEELARLMRDTSKEFQKIQAESLKKDFQSIVSGSQEDAFAARAAAPGAAAKPGAAGGKTPNLDQYTVNLTENAKSGKIDPVLGRDFEVRQIIDILMRRRQNNPILTGEAGVGKTAVVEGFALRVVKGDVPPPLRNVTIRTLDLALLQAGAGVKGEFENRLKGLIEEVKSSPTPIILFIDEAHTMIGAGGQAGQNDAANLLKPALARGELRTIAATTWSEYKKFFEKDAALARRFQVVKVEEPTEQQCMVMLRGIGDSLEKHHGVRILHEAVTSAVKLSHRYLAGRQLPDKAVSVLDTACARLSLGQSATPAAVEDLTRQLDDLAVQERILNREAAAGSDHAERLAEIAKQKSAVEAKLAAVNEKWQKTTELVGKIRDVRAQLEKAAAGDGDALRQELNKLNAELDVLGGDSPLMRVCTDEQIVSEVISAWTGIPVGKMLTDEISLVLELESHLGKRVIGQEHALSVIGQRIAASRARLEDPGKPVGVFMLIGPSGVGKTETALA
ncbi:MAG TPA: AAA family ATPase, partial [Bryobacteraceae bacterium]|nr:AAA family ATPase [Bryobacteraceae bacterium]